MMNVTELVAVQRQRVPALSSTDLLALLGNPALRVIDVREPEEVADTGRIPGAVAVPRGVLEFKADATSPVHDAALDSRRRTVVYCASGGRAVLAAAALLDLGYEDVSYLDGGMRAWAGDGYPVTED